MYRHNGKYIRKIVTTKQVRCKDIGGQSGYGWQTKMEEEPNTRSGTDQTSCSGHIVAVATDGGDWEIDGGD